jgi:hypothetical protein
VLGLHERADLYEVDSARQQLVPVPTPDSAGRALIDNAIAYFQGADAEYRGGAYHFEPSPSRSSERTATAAR